MSSLLIDSEKKLYECYLNSSDELIKHYKFLREKVDLNLTEKEISTAILLRLKAYYDSQVKIKEFLGKRYIAAGADFFVETILFYLKLILEKMLLIFGCFLKNRLNKDGVL